MNTVLCGKVNPVVTRRRSADVHGTLLPFVSKLEQNAAGLSVMRGGVPAGAVIPLHSHTDPEIFYLVEGKVEIYQDEHEAWFVPTHEELPEMYCFFSAISDYSSSPNLSFAKSDGLE